MTKLQRQLAWEEIVRETHKRAKLGEKLKDKKISLLGDLLLVAGAILEKVERGENKEFNTMIFKKTMRFYCARMKEYER